MIIIFIICFFYFIIIMNYNKIKLRILLSLLLFLILGIILLLINKVNENYSVQTTQCNQTYPVCVNKDKEKIDNNKKNTEKIGGIEVATKIFDAEKFNTQIDLDIQKLKTDLTEIYKEFDYGKTLLKTYEGTIESIKNKIDKEIKDVALTGEKAAATLGEMNIQNNNYVENEDLKEVFINYVKDFISLSGGNTNEAELTKITEWSGIEFNEQGEGEATKYVITDGSKINKYFKDIAETIDDLTKLKQAFLEDVSSNPGSLLEMINEKSDVVWHENTWNEPKTQPELKQPGLKQQIENQKLRITNPGVEKFKAKYDSIKTGGNTSKLKYNENDKKWKDDSNSKTAHEGYKILNDLKQTKSVYDYHHNILNETIISYKDSKEEYDTKKTEFENQIGIYEEEIESAIINTDLTHKQIIDKLKKDIIKKGDEKKILTKNIKVHNDELDNLKDKIKVLEVTLDEVEFSRKGRDDKQKKWEKSKLEIVGIEGDKKIIIMWDENNDIAENDSYYLDIYDDNNISKRLVHKINSDDLSNHTSESSNKKTYTIDKLFNNVKYHIKLILINPEGWKKTSNVINITPLKNKMPNLLDYSNLNKKSRISNKNNDNPLINNLRGREFEIKLR